MDRNVRESQIFSDCEILMPLLASIVAGWKVGSRLLWEVTGGQWSACVFRGNKTRADVSLRLSASLCFSLDWDVCGIRVCVCLLAGWYVLHLIPSGGWSPLCMHLHFNPCSCSLIGSFRLNWLAGSINSMIVVQMYVEKNLSSTLYWNVKCVFMWIIAQTRPEKKKSASALTLTSYSLSSRCFLW